VLEQRKLTTKTHRRIVWPIVSRHCNITWWPFTVFCNYNPVN